MKTTTPSNAPATARAAYGWRSHYTLVLLLFVYTMSFIDRQIMGILMQPIKQEFQVSDTAMGVLGGLTFALFYSVLAIPFGRYADRANRRNFVAYCCAAWSGMTALCGMVTGYWTLALARVGVAIGEAGGTAPSLSMVADHYPPQQRGRAMGVYWLGPQLGILFGLTLGGWIAQHHGWRAAFVWMAIPGVVAAVLLRFSGVEPARGRWEAGADAAASVESLGTLVRHLRASRAFVRITLAGLMMGFAGYGIGIWTPAFLVRSHGMTLQGAGAVMGLLGGVAAAVGALASGWLCDRLARRDARWRVGVPLLGCVLSVPTGLAFYLMPAGEVWHVGSMVVPHAVGWYVLFGLTAVWWTAPVYTVLADLVAPHRRATTVAFFNLGMTMVGGGLGPLLVGFLSDSLVPYFGAESLRYALAFTTGSCYALGVLFFFLAMQAYARERVAPGA
ncbi:MFS transporter [Rhodoferax lacus]|uniref:MFS transporter n=1 Tax=Rhodoferax lacus TaxID=2184758 RepID=A0A3E1R7G4_9BURK|nr:MFS transporter [Rhodoferax lacus]RFO94982.1 MFS transporter [Rhodoferax lacus]